MEMMAAFLLERIGEVRRGDGPLVARRVERPEPAAGEILLRVGACGVCHTELDEIEGRTPPPRLPIIPGHQVVGKVVALGEGVNELAIGERVGVAWIYSACGSCALCCKGLENLCHHFQATGRDRNGGYAEYMVVPAKSAYRIPSLFADAEAAPLLCGGAIGYRALRLAGLENGETLGLMGFGASAHIVLQLARATCPDSRVLVFARAEEQRRFAIQLGADWAGGIEEEPPCRPQAIIDTTPAWAPIVSGLRILERGGRLVVNAIRKEQGDFDALTGLSYEDHLWLEKEVKSVANITRADVREFLDIAANLPIRPTVMVYPFAQANEALCDLRAGQATGARVLVMADGENGGSGLA